MNRHEDIQEQLSAYVDGQLGDEEARRVEQAIHVDESLARDLAAIRATRDVLRGEQTLSPSPDFVDRVLAEAKRRNLIPAPQPAAQAAGQAAPRAAGLPAPRRWLASWQVRLAAAASLVLAAAAGGTVAVLFWANRPSTPPAAATGGAKDALLADAEGEARHRTGKSAFKQDYRRQADDGWAYAEKGAAGRYSAAEPLPEGLASDRLRSSLPEVTDKLQRTDGAKEDLYYANAKAIVRDLAGDSRTGGLAGRRGGAAKSGPINDLAAAEEEASAETVQKLDLHVTHLAAARREVAAILTAGAAPAATGGLTRSKAAGGEVSVALAPAAAPAPAATAVESPGTALPKVAAKPAASGAAPAPTAAPAATAPAATATPAPTALALTDRTGPPPATDRAGLGDRMQPATSPAQRASALASLRGMACDGSAGAGVWKFVIVDTPARIDRISQAVRRVGVLDHDAESGQRLCVAEPEPATHAQVPGRKSQSQSAPYRVAEIQRRPEPRTAAPLRLLIITLRAEPAPPASNANPDRNLTK